MMKRALIVACGSYVETTYGCPGEWRCLKAAALGQGRFKEPVQVLGFITCKCPGITLIPNIYDYEDVQGETGEIYLSTCMLRRPGCPYRASEEWAKLIEEATGVKVILGTHGCTQRHLPELAGG